MAARELFVGLMSGTSMDGVDAALVDPLAVLPPRRALGIDPDWVEAIAFTWLAKPTLDGRPGNLAAIAGATDERVLGAIYPA